MVTLRRVIMNNALWMNELDREFDNAMECERIRKEIFEMSIDIFAHAELDWEWDCANACEASYVAVELLRLLGLSVQDRDVQAHIAKRVRELLEELS